ncbi:MAG: response regulator transcription factor [Chloroflexi bacterium]|nr:response regulator transcription factor [Chloroflexota bacterium]
MRVFLACEPPLLREVLAMALSQVPEVELVDEAGVHVDVVLASLPASNGGWPANLPLTLPPQARWVQLDPSANVLRVQQGQGGPAGGELLAGNLTTLMEVVQRWASGLGLPTAQTG